METLRVVKKIYIVYLNSDTLEDYSLDQLLF